MAEPITSLPNGLNVGTTNTGAAFQVDGTEITASATELNETALVFDLANVSAASSAWVVAPHAGDITKIYSVIDTALTTAVAVLDPQIGGTTMTGGTFAIAAAAVAGEVDSSTPTAANTVTAGQAIEIATDGGSTNASKAVITMILTR